jgi:arylsulfatase A-like enzyme
VTDEPWAFWDFLPTAADLAGVALPSGLRIDGLSLASFLRGGPAPARDHFYWELHEGGRSIQAARWGDWKAVRNGPSQPIEIYDLNTDTAESRDLAGTRPDLVARAGELFRSAREDHPDWPLIERRPMATPKR